MIKTKRVIIVHCWGGKPNYCWYPWVKARLEAQGFKVEVPALPNTDLPQLSEWLPALAQAIDQPDDELVIVSHSLGTITALKYLAQLPAGAKIGGMVIVAGNCTDRGHAEMTNFFVDMPDLADAASHVAQQIQLIYSDDDPWVPPAEGRVYEQALDARFTLMKGMGHFSGPVDDPTSCTRLPEVVVAVEKLAQN